MSDKFHLDAFTEDKANTKHWNTGEWNGGENWWNVSIAFVENISVSLAVRAPFWRSNKLRQIKGQVLSGISGWVIPTWPTFKYTLQIPQTTFQSNLWSNRYTGNLFTSKFARFRYINVWIRLPLGPVIRDGWRFVYWFEFQRNHRGHR